MDVPAPVRGLAVALAAVVLFLNGPQASAALGQEPLMVAAHASLLLLFVPLLVWVAASPRGAGGWLHDRLGLDLQDPGDVVGGLIHLVFVYLVVALTVLSTAQAATTFLETGRHPVQDGGLEAAGIIQGLVLNMLLFAVAAVTWLALVEDRSPAQILQDLGLELEDLPMGLVWGVVTTLAVLAGLIGIGLVAQATGYAPDNPQADAIAGAPTPGLAVLVATLAGIGEELYFRGFLLPRTGNLIQAALFGLIHATYLTPLQVILPFALGLIFGWVRRKTSLWAVIVAHATYNTVVLFTTIYAEELQLAIAALIG